MNDISDQYLDTPWLHELCNHPVLSAQEELSLIRKYLNEGDMEARNRLVRHNQRFVLRVVVGLVPQGVIRSIGILDLMNVGNEGLIRAIDKFDVDRGTRLSTYASWWIKTHVQRFSVCQKPLLTMSDRVLQRRRKQMRLEAKRVAREGGSQDLGDGSYREAMITWALLAPADIFGHYQTDEAVLSLADVIPDHSSSVEDEVGHDRHVEAIRRRWRQVRERFTPRERFIVENRLMASGEDSLTLQEVGRRFGVSRERIRQVEANLMTQLQSLFEDFK